VGAGSARPVGLSIEPGDATVQVVDGVAEGVKYRAIYRSADGSEQDVTGETTFAVADTGLGSFAGATFQPATDRAGHTKVSASARGQTAEAALVVRLRAVIREADAPVGAAELFGGTEDAARAPELVYPPDGVMVPPNLARMEFHFRGGTGNTVFELEIAGSAVELKIYFPCRAIATGGCHWQPSEATWKLIAGAERGQEPVTYKLRGSDGNRGPVGSSAPRKLHVGAENISGGVYYWASTPGVVKRYDFGRNSAVAEDYLDATRTGASTCVGCHTLSRDGSRVAIGLDVPTPARYQVYDVATRSKKYESSPAGPGPIGGAAGGANFFAFNPDATQLLTSDGRSIVLRDGNTGAAAAGNPLVASGTMPDWSGDGKHIVYATPTISSPGCGAGAPCDGMPSVSAAGLELISHDGTGWGAPVQLVPYDGQNNFYPAFSPDSQWVLFNRSPGHIDSYDAPDARVWAVPVAGGKPVALGNASAGGDSWPKWVPAAHQHRGKSLMWFTFSSRRPCGLRSSPGLRGDTPAQLWMAAFDPSRPDDPSYPAFWLPFQDLQSGNHIAQWTMAVARQSCETTDCPADEFCYEGKCYPRVE
jgi:hypothetical protein